MNALSDAFLIYCKPSSEKGLSCTFETAPSLEEEFFFFFQYPISPTYHILFNQRINISLINNE